MEYSITSEQFSSTQDMYLFDVLRNTWNDGIMHDESLLMTDHQ
jgi:hypothetical protein